MTKFIVGAWVLLVVVIAGTQMFDFWRVDSSSGLSSAKFCEGSACLSDQYKARVFYLYGDTDRVLIRDSADIQVGCGAEKASHWKAKSIMRGDSVEDVRGRSFVDRQAARTKIVSDLSVFLPCDAPPDSSAFGVAVAVPVWVKARLAGVRAYIGNTATSLDVTR